MSSTELQRTPRARRFLEAFSAAAHDAQLEREGYEIYHFFDSDFLNRLIFGYEDSINQGLIHDSKSHAGTLARQKLLMGALIGQRLGAPPLIRALLPHLYEVRQSVEGPRTHGQGYRVDEAMADLGVEESLADLRSALSERDLEPDELLDHFVSQGPQIFYGVELLSGRWDSRLGRVLALGIREPGPFENEAEIVGSDDFEVLAEQVVHFSDTRRAGSVRGLRDAMALTTLARAVSKRDPDKKLARFYTETKRILDAWDRSAEMRALLTYRTRERKHPDDDYGAHGVLRTVEYYLIRALIPELGYMRAATDEHLRPEGVYEIADELTEAVKELREAGFSDEAVSDVRIGRHTLGDIMTLVTDLPSYGSAWRSLAERMPPKLPKTLVEQLNEVLAGEQLRAGDLGESLRKQVQELSSRTRDVESFTKDYKHAREVLNRWTGALRPRYGNYAEHFGLTRWGLLPTDEDEEALNRLIDRYERTGFPVEVAQRLRDMRTAPMRGPDHLADCVALLGFLWHMDDYATVAKYGEVFQRAIKSAPLALAGTSPPELLRDERWTTYGSVVENLTGAAEVAAEVAKLRDAPRGKVEEDLLAQANQVVERLGESRRRFVATQEARAVAQGYVMFLVWLAFNRTLMADSQNRVPVRQKALARRSLKVCSAGLERCEPAASMYPLLLNHCVYVASMARLVDERIEDLARELMVLRLSQRHTTSYRLDDTLGYFYYARAAATWAESAGRDHADRTLTESAAADLAQARRWLDFVPAEVSDPEVIAHRALVHELERAISLVRRPAPEAKV